ncbi:diacylglycerol/lipid kinase family protein [Aquirufa lenticrescens]|uniref:diacylglycerol/lipid kinase family protein n=1 Tax=Aquirufa lenticrescens TaxID=2696560 RepID=UPI001CAA7532|nr:diacylglycerol kinase family protein [Aquirufa lenticrescens]UAJ15118.1 diacylglycerol kinase family lipid kinase [Aquirufa lenticrescens]
MIHFILNPNAGTNSLQKRERIVKSLNGIPNSKVWQTERVKHASELTEIAISKGATKVIAIGGDGTINEVASALLYSNIPLGIIPMGSGNGLARHLQIPLQFDKALHKALNGTIISIDAGKWNERPFFCTAGIGFDAQVAAHFANRGKRGFLNYLYSTLVSLNQYQAIAIKDKGKVFSFTVANANQFGNNAYISPESDLQDGLLETILIKPGSILALANLGISLFRKNLPLHPLVSVSSVHTLQIEASEGIPYHLDGESLTLTSNRIEIAILPSALLVVK